MCRRDLPWPIPTYPLPHWACLLHWRLRSTTSPKSLLWRYRSSWPKKSGFLYKAAFLSGLAEPFGAIIGLVAAHLHHALNPLFMAFAAGAMVFISIHELLPMAKRYHRINLFILACLFTCCLTQLSRSNRRKKVVTDFGLIYASQNHLLRDNFLA